MEDILVYILGSCHSAYNSAIKHEKNHFVSLHVECEGNISLELAIFPIKEIKQVLFYKKCKGCYFTDDPPKENDFEVIKGQKWCLGYETAPESEDSFSAVIGAGGWSIALTASEFNDFCQLIQTLRKGIATMDEDGFIGKDDISMQVEKGSIWMECTIPKKRVAILQNFWKLGNWGLLDNHQTSAFELRFVISGSGRRQAEGFWPAEAVMDMLKKIDAMNSEQGDVVEAGL